jgi:hypothetical protein
MQGSTDGIRSPRHFCAQGSTDGAEMPGYWQCLPSEEEEGRASPPQGKMKSVPTWALYIWTRAVHGGGTRRQRVWLVTVAEEGKRGGECNNQPKEGRAGCRAPTSK